MILNILLISKNQYLAQQTSQKLSPSVDRSIYRAPTLDKCAEIGEPVTLIPKLAVSLKSFPKCYDNHVEEE